MTRVTSERGWNAAERGRQIIQKRGVVIAFFSALVWNLNLSRPNPRVVKTFGRFLASFAVSSNFP
jgi:hypothetical protein